MVFPWGDSRPWNSLAGHLRRTLGYRLQKLSVDAGFSCPNRNSTNRLLGGCTFCNNNAFNPSYCSPEKSITQQLNEGILFHRKRYHNTPRYLAYFQPYSNTYAPLKTLKSYYDEALAHPLVDGIVISTRPDCIDEQKLEMLASIAEKKQVTVEYGIESCYDTTLKTINRGHTFETTRRAIELTASYGINCGGHLILGLPGETKEMMLEETEIINNLPISTLKMHQLQILTGTAMEQQAKERPSQFGQFALEEYITLVCDILERLRPDLMIERLAGEVPPRFQAFPNRSWRRSDGRLIRNEEIPALVEKELTRRGTHQGSKHSEFTIHCAARFPRADITIH